jgi:hypothetical protein
MGGGVRIFYGTAKFYHPDDGTDPPKNVTFHID